MYYRALLANSLLSISHRHLPLVTFACLLSSATPAYHLCYPLLLLVLAFPDVLRCCYIYKLLCIMPSCSRFGLLREQRSLGNNVVVLTRFITADLSFRREYCERFSAIMFSINVVALLLISNTSPVIFLNYFYM